MEAELPREATLADAGAIAEVQVASWHAAYPGLVPGETLTAFTVDVRRARWEKNLAELDRRRRTTVIERDGRVVAFATIGASRDEPGVGEVWSLYAHPEAWGTGAGRALLEDGLAALAEAGTTRVMLWVLEGNVRAIRFYEAAGFRLDGIRKVEDGLPHIHMVR